MEEAVQRLDTRLNDALLADVGEIEIIHGVGTGRVKAAVHRHLRKIGAVKRFALDPRNPGVTRVWL